MYEHCKTCTHNDGGIGWCDKCVYTIFHRKTGLPPTEYERREEPKPITNADRIRSMSDEELADFLDETDSVYWDRQTWLDWLKEEATDGDHYH